MGIQLIPSDFQGSRLATSLLLQQYHSLYQRTRLYLVNKKNDFLFIFYSFFDKLQECAKPDYTPSIQDSIVLSELNLPTVARVLPTSISSLVLSEPKHDFTQTLHLDILVQICQYLPLQTLLPMLRLNKKLNALMNSDIFWEKLALSTCGGILNVDKGEWKSSFLLLHKKRSVGIKDVSLDKLWRLPNACVFFVFIIYRIVSTCNIEGERRKYVNMFEDIHQVIFVVDLLCFNYYNVSDEYNIWSETVMLFDEMANSRYKIYISQVEKC